jgi:hypothetical protein
LKLEAGRPLPYRVENVGFGVDDLGLRRHGAIGDVAWAR